MANAPGGKDRVRVSEKREANVPYRATRGEQTISETDILLLMTPYRRRPGASAYDWIVSRNRYSYEIDGVARDTVAA
jgi:hypothetical protein